METTNPLAELESLPILRFRRSWRSLIPWFIGSFIIGWLALWGTATFPASVISISFSETFEARVPLLIILWLAATIRPFLLLIDAHYEIGHHHIRAVTGIISLHRRSVEIAYEDLLTVEVEQTIIDRILFVGNVVAGSAMSDAPRIVMEGIGCPDRYASLIDHRVDLTRELTRSRFLARTFPA